MEKNNKIAVFPGDGIGVEVVREAVKVLDALAEKTGAGFALQYGLVGGAAYDACGDPFPPESLALARSSDAVLLGAVGGPKWEGLDYRVRPERALLGLREKLGLFANLRPVAVFPELRAASPLKARIVRGIDILIIRELTGDLYFGKPRGVRVVRGRRVGVNTLVYTEEEIRRIARVAFAAARHRRRKLLSVDKANVLESTQLWRDVVTEVGRDYPDVALSHMYVDNCAMQLVANPSQFDVIVTTNMFGDILSDEAAMITGSIGMLPSASLGEKGGMYEPIHGSAPDIAGRDLANPLATILSVAMMLRHSLGMPREAGAVEAAVRRVLRDGYRTRDIHTPGTVPVGTAAMGDAVVSRLVLKK
ncbi:MAG TPA: 3-isopropylmalate dehydrogenase [Syntrophales bacterium]|jgi:3-isopropylmalate dehydrogenase|nr:3-isopropylmalate dehydrogenase [Syntrophales bacterium]HOU78674.1 3-isopropylmalate dehydrogenase [Syntrophales bacterium]HPC33007.1 3-isopropylmalate dehydrogenase [Syntrophales bacterium]HQG34373.1 3-isopropylmalate dehydrogenase [Syntrophales bacterium]HRR47734.1 3-isopropylmalate dehydrogenase [Syntrophales bacterium]